MVESPSYVVSFYYRKILVPIDGSESSMKALHVATDFAYRYGSKVVVAYAKPKGCEPVEDPIAKARERLKEVPVNIAYKYLEYDPVNESPQAVILREIVNEGYDLIILGARGRTVLGEINVGSVPLSLVANAPVSLFIVR